MHRIHCRYPHHHFCKVEKTPLCIPHWKHQLPSCHHSFHHRCPAMTNHNVLKKIYLISQYLLITMKTKSSCSQICSVPFTFTKLYMTTQLKFFSHLWGFCLTGCHNYNQFSHWWRTRDENLHSKWHCTMKWSQD